MSGPGGCRKRAWSRLGTSPREASPPTTSERSEAQLCGAGARGTCMSQLAPSPAEVNAWIYSSDLPRGAQEVGDQALQWLAPRLLCELSCSSVAIVSQGREGSLSRRAGGGRRDELHWCGKLAVPWARWRRKPARAHSSGSLGAVRSGAGDGDCWRRSRSSGVWRSSSMTRLTQDPTPPVEVA